MKHRPKRSKPPSFCSSNSAGFPSTLCAIQICVFT